MNRWRVVLRGVVAVATPLLVSVPSQARFLQTDPVGYADDLDMYTYVQDDPTDKTDPTGRYELTPCGDNHACSSGAGEFETQRQNDLHNSDPQVVESAKAWGDPGEANGVTITLKSPHDVAREAHANGADANTTPGVDPSSPDKPNIQASVSWGLTGGDMARTAAHEGSHIDDAVKFIKSYNSKGTHKYDASKNYTKRKSETKAFHTGNAVKPYGYHSETQLQNSITHAYANPDQPVWQGDAIE